MRTDTTTPGTVTIGGDLTVGNIGYGAMQLTGPKVWGEYPDHDKGVALLREVVAEGVTFLDTADVYGPHSNEELIREARRGFCIPEHVPPHVAQVRARTSTARDGCDGDVRDRSPDRCRTRARRDRGFVLADDLIVAAVTAQLATDVLVVPARQVNRLVS